MKHNCDMLLKQMITLQCIFDGLLMHLKNNKTHNYGKSYNP